MVDWNEGKTDYGVHRRKAEGSSFHRPRIYGCAEGRRGDADPRRLGGAIVTVGNGVRVSEHPHARLERL